MDQIDIPGYVFKLKNRKTKSTNKSGGIALGFKEQLSDKISPVETECRFVFWFKVSADKNPIIIYQSYFLFYLCCFFYVASYSYLRSKDYLKYQSPLSRGHHHL
jgi:hypothetical protein